MVQQVISWFLILVYEAKGLQNIELILSVASFSSTVLEFIWSVVVLDDL